MQNDFSEKGCVEFSLEGKGPGGGGGSSKATGIEV